MTLRQRKSGKPPRKMTPAQVEANRRSFRIFQLRGLYGLAHILTPDRRAAVHALIDADIAELGAEPQSKRMADDRALWERLDAPEAADKELDDWLPF